MKNSDNFNQSKQSTGATPRLKGEDKNMRPFAISAPKLPSPSISVKRTRPLTHSPPLRPTMVRCLKLKLWLHAHKVLLIQSFCGLFGISGSVSAVRSNTENWAGLTSHSRTIVLPWRKPNSPEYLFYFSAQSGKLTKGVRQQS